MEKLKLRLVAFFFYSSGRWYLAWRGGGKHFISRDFFILIMPLFCTCLNITRCVWISVTVSFGDHVMLDLCFWQGLKFAGLQAWW